MSGSVEVHIRHVMDGNLSIPKNSCFRAFPMNWPVRNLMRHVICELEVIGFFQKLVESSLSILLLPVHFSMLGKFSEIRSRSLIRSCFLGYLLKNLTGPLLGVASLEGQSSFWK